MVFFLCLFQVRIDPDGDDDSGDKSENDSSIILENGKCACLRMFDKHFGS